MEGEKNWTSSMQVLKNEWLRSYGNYFLSGFIRSLSSVICFAFLSCCPMQKAMRGPPPHTVCLSPTLWLSTGDISKNYLPVTIVAAEPLAVYWHRFFLLLQFSSINQVTESLCITHFMQRYKNSTMVVFFIISMGFLYLPWAKSLLFVLHAI